MKHIALCSLLLPVFSASSVLAVGLIDLRTTTANNVNTITDRLYLDNAFSIEAPVGSALWIVWDANADGLLFNTSGSGNVPLTGLLGGDDQIVMNVDVDGSIIGDQTGRFQQIGLSLTDAANVSGQSFYAFLWHPSTGGNTSGNPDSLGEVTQGMTFGVSANPLNFVHDDALIAGNGRIDISANISASQFTAVPEPEEYAALFGAALAGFALWRRHSRRG